MRFLMPVLIALCVLLQCRFWLGEGSYIKVLALKETVTNHQERINTLKARNELLEAEVDNLKHHLDALQERARIDFGMIIEGETFIQEVPQNG